MFAQTQHQQITATHVYYLIANLLYLISNENEKLTLSDFMIKNVEVEVEVQVSVTFNVIVVKQLSL